MTKIFGTDISEKKEFDRIGIHYKQVYADDINHIYLYQMDNRENAYELVKGKKRKNPDGNIVYVYPSDEDFGTLGWYIVGTKEYTEKKIAEIMLFLTGGPPKF